MRRSSRVLASSAAAALLALGATSCSDGEPDPGAAPSTSADPASQTAAAVDVLLQSGLDAAAAGDTATARTSFDGVLALDPGNVEATYNLGQLAQVAGRDGEAMRRYDQALALDPDFVPALFNRAILLEASDLEAAVAAYERVIELDETRAPAYIRLGFALEELGEDARAAEVREQGLALDPSLASAERPTY